MGKDKWAEVIEYLRTSNRDPKKTLKLLKGNEKGHQSNYNINRSSYTLNIIAAITQKTLDPKNKNSRIIEALNTINRLAFVKDKSMPAIFISGPILWTVNCCIGLLAI